MDKLPVILIVDDDPRDRERIKTAYNGIADVFEATTIEEAEREIRRAGHRLLLLYIDGNLSQHFTGNCETLDFARKVTAMKKLSGLIVAYSSFWNRELLGAGCDLAMDKAFSIDEDRQAVFHGTLAAFNRVGRNWAKLRKRIKEFDPVSREKDPLTVLGRIASK